MCFLSPQFPPPFSPSKAINNYTCGSDHATENQGVGSTKQEYNLFRLCNTGQHLNLFNSFQEYSNNYWHECQWMVKYWTTSFALIFLFILKARHQKIKFFKLFSHMLALYEMNLKWYGPSLLPFPELFLMNQDRV